MYDRAVGVAYPEKYMQTRLVVKDNQKVKQLVAEVFGKDTLLACDKARKKELLKAALKWNFKRFGLGVVAHYWQFGVPQGARLLSFPSGTVRQFGRSGSFCRDEKRGRSQLQPATQGRENWKSEFDGTTAILFAGLYCRLLVESKIRNPYYKTCYF